MFTDPPKRRRAPAADGRYVVGLTGGIASGKSTVARVLVERGARRVEADRLGHAVLEQPAVREEIRSAFGDAVFDASGAVDRRALGREVFADESARRRLNEISHPRLLAAARAALDESGRDGFRGVVVFEAALLVEWDLGPWCDEVVAVRAPLPARRARAAAALGVSEEEAARRIAAQLPDEERVRYADRVLDNDGTLEEWERRARELADALWAAWRAREGAPR